MNDSTISHYSLYPEKLAAAVGKRIVAFSSEHGWPVIELDDSTRIIATGQEEVWLERQD